MESMNDIVTAQNTEDGSVGRYPRSIVDHPVLGRYLKEVPFGTKPKIPLKDVVAAAEQAKTEEEAPKRKKTDG